MTMKKIGAAIIAVILIAGGGLYWYQTKKPGEVVLEGGLVVKDILVGEGEEAVLHAVVKVHYTGRLMDGTKFDSSMDRDAPFEFNLGFGQVIQGWEQGVVGMRVGGKRELTIPPELAYGERGAGEAIPPNSTLKFEIELLGVEGPGYANIDPAAYQELVAGGAKAFDIRNEEEWKTSGVIENAVLLSAFAEFGQIVPTFPEALEAAADRDEKVILIGSADDQRAAVLALILVRRAGYHSVFHLQRGVEGWKEDGLPLVEPVLTTGQ